MEEKISSRIDALKMYDQFVQFTLLWHDIIEWMWMLFWDAWMQKRNLKAEIQIKIDKKFLHCLQKFKNAS